MKGTVCSEIRNPTKIICGDQKILIKPAKINILHRIEESINLLIKIPWLCDRMIDIVTNVMYNMSCRESPFLKTKKSLTYEVNSIKLKYNCLTKINSNFVCCPFLGARPL